LGTGKICLLCGGDRTTIQRKRGDGNYENWYRHGGADGGVICSICYQRKKREPKENRSCSICRSHNSRVSRRGDMLWYFLDGKERVCYRCRLDSILRERQLKNQSSRCTSETCRQAREDLNVSYDYTTKAYCSKCETQHPIDLPRCPCCHYKMRKRPVHLSAKRNRKLLEESPMTYH
jgi:hypothetical protein